MRKSSRLLLTVVLLLDLFLTGCMNETTGGVGGTAQESEPQQIEIKDLSDAWNTILNGSTKEFIGGHPIDEGFLAMVTGIYGDEAIEEIASYANFTTPEIWYSTTGKSIHVLWYEYCMSTGIQTYSFENTYVLNTNSDEEIVLDFTGDLTFAEGVATTTYMDQQLNGVTDCFSKKLLAEMQSADILTVNNEFAYTDRGTALSGKAYTFRANPNRVRLLDSLGVDLVSLANNHVYDYDAEGFADTLDIVEAHGMPYIGAGKNIDEASKPYYAIIGGRKIAIVSATQIERSLNYTKEATTSEGGVLKCLHPQRFCSEIAKAKANADYCIVFVHWGTEGNSHYGADQMSLARSFVEAGADVIVGGHTHCLQTVEYMDDVPIYYSLGNYYFSTTSSMPNPYDTGVAQLRIQQDGSIEAYFLPCHFEAGVTSLLSSGDEASGRIINNLNSLSETAVINEDGLISKKQTE